MVHQFISGVMNTSEEQRPSPPFIVALLCCLGGRRVLSFIIRGCLPSMASVLTIRSVFVRLVDLKNEKFAMNL